MSPDHLESLRLRKCWVLWRYEPDKKGRLTKRPKRRNGSSASITDPASWCTFDQVNPVPERMAGYGLILGGDLGGLDLDACLFDGKLESWAQEVVDRLDTYTEISPSGVGVKLLFRTTDEDRSNREVSWGKRVVMPDGSTKQRELALYRSGRYFTVTERVFCHKPIRTISPEDVTWVIQRIESKKAKKPKNQRAAQTRATQLVRSALPVALLELIATPGDVDDRSDEFHRAVGWCKTIGMSRQDALALFEAHPHGIADKYQGRLAKEFERSWDKADEPAPGVDELPVMPKLADAASIASDYVDPFAGAMTDLTEAILAASPVAQPTLALMASVAAMAASIPSRYALRSGGRLNLYCLGVAPTGAGKDKPRTCAVTVAASAGAAILGKPGSGQGLEDALGPLPMLVEADEIGHVLQSATGTNAPPHMVALHEVLLRLFSASSGTWHRRTLAKNKGDKPAPPVENPCLSILGFTTPSALGKALSVSDVESGLLGRFLFAAADDDVEPRLLQSMFEMPQSVIKVTTALRKGTGKRICIEVDPQVVPALEDVLRSMHRRGLKTESTFAKALCVRAFEKTERLAGVLAVWDNPTSPRMTLEHLAWARAFVAASDRAMVAFVESFLHGSEVLANAARVLDVMTRILVGKVRCDRRSEADAVDAGWVPHSLLLRRSKLSNEALKKSIEHLSAARQIDVLVRRSANLAGRQYDALNYRPVLPDVPEVPQIPDSSENS